MVLKILRNTSKVLQDSNNSEPAMVNAPIAIGASLNVEMVREPRTMVLNLNQ